MNTLLSTATILTLASAPLLWQGWRARRAGRPRQRLVLTLSGWGVLWLASLLWMRAAGADRGVAFGMLLFMLAGFGLVLLTNRNGNNARRRVAREPRVNGIAPALSGGRLLLRRIWVFLLAGPVSATVALLLTSNAFAWWNITTGSEANRLAAALLIMPFAWALLAIWTTYDIPLRRRSLVMLGTALLSVAGILLASELP